MSQLDQLFYKVEFELLIHSYQPFLKDGFIVPFDIVYWLAYIHWRCVYSVGDQPKEVQIVFRGFSVTRFDYTGA